MLEQGQYVCGSKTVTDLAQVCTSHREIAVALEVWKHPPVGPSDPEAAFRSNGGGRGKLQSFFAPSKSKTFQVGQGILCNILLRDESLETTMERFWLQCDLLANKHEKSNT